jgi:hypothetical protein
MLDMHSDYASQLVTAFDYQYANLYTKSTALGWVAQWPPDPALAAEAAQTCGPFWNFMQILAQAAGNASLPVTPAGRSMKGDPSTSLSDAWPRVPRQENRTWNDKNSVRAGDAVVSTWVWFLRGALSAVGLSTNNVYDALASAFHETLNAVHCDLESIQTCKHWKVLLLHSAIVNSVFFSVWFLVASGARLSFLASLSVILFVPAVLYLSYGYSPFCIPMVPTCIFEDAVRSLRLVFPRFMRVPQAFVRDAIVDGQPCYKVLENPSIFDPKHAACVRTCDETPLKFTSWRAVFAWIVAELGQDAVDWTLDVQKHVPLLDHHDMQEQLLLKNGIWRIQDDSLVNAHRVCAAIHSYLLAPYLVICILATTAVVATLLVVLIPALIPFLAMVAQLYTAMFVVGE